MLSKIEECIPALRRYALALVQDRQRADDLVHSCLVRAFDKLHTPRDDVGLRAWLFGIIHNLYVSRWRCATMRRNAEALTEHEGNNAFSGLNGQEDRSKEAVRALNSLPEDQRAVILLVSVADLSYAEAGIVLDVPIGTVTSRLACGREHMRQFVDEVKCPPLPA